MKKLVYVFLAAITFGLTSCADIDQHVYINADGSGEIDSQLDMSEMIWAIGLSQMFKDSTENTVDINFDNPEGFMAQMMESAKKGKIDTSVNLFTVFPDSVKAKMNNPALLKNMNMNVVFDKDKDVLKFGNNIKYDHPSVLEETMTMFADNKDTKAESKNDQISKFLDYLPKDLHSGTIAFDGKSMLEKLVGDVDVKIDEMTDEELDDITDMTGNGSMTTTFHLPGNVKSIKGDGLRKLDNRTVEVKITMKDLINNRGLDNYVIVYDASKVALKR